MPQIKVEKLVFGGQALGYYNDKPIFVWNALPGEVVEVDITKHRKGVYEGVAREIIEKSEDRIAAQEAHFLSCSPWQIMTYEAENKYKLEICAEAFKKINNLPSPQYHFPQERFGYRNKMEYSLQVINGKTNLALNERQGHNFVNCSHCVLPDEALQTTATAIEAWLNQGVLTRRLLKSLIIRSDGAGKTIAGLFVKDRVSFVNPKIDCKNLQGWDIYFSTHRSPASVVTEVLYQSGEAYLTATIDGKKFEFGMESFMQNNMVMYEHALNEMKKWINEGDELLDMFSGVGSIGICLAGKKQKLTLVEINQEASEYAKENIVLNGLESVADAVCLPAEKALEYISHEQVVVVDPPRAGLHQKLTDKLLEVLPKMIIYLSCNPATQARDLEQLMLKYQARDWRVYNFFPSTPHIESLIVLERI